MIRTRQVVFSEGEKKQKFFLSLWNLKVELEQNIIEIHYYFKANKERIRRTQDEKRRKERRQSRLSRQSSSSSDSSILYK